MQPEQLGTEDPMSIDNPQDEGRDLGVGVPLDKLPEGAIVAGHVGGESAVLVRKGSDLFVVGATCTHYGGPLAKGLLAGNTIRCPWHHACFDLRTGEPLRAPALDPIPRWQVEVREGVAFVGAKLDPHAPRTLERDSLPRSILIVGGGPAGNAAVETLRREGYRGPVTMLSADQALPCDRPNLSKDYLAGKAPEEWTVLRTADFYQSNDIDVRLNTRVTRIDTELNEVRLEDGTRLGYGALLLATGAEPIRLNIPGADRAHVHYLRTLHDGRALAEKAKTARSAVVVGASFIGLEVASSLSARGIQVHVVGPEAIPMARILGDELGSFVRSVHELHGVTFHLGRTAAAIDAGAVTLTDGTRIAADLVVIGIGVRPATTLAEQAGLETDRGIMVDEFLETSAPNVFAAGDIARWPDRRSGEHIRVEHFVVAERQGQTAARNMLGQREPFDAVPFFWTEQHDLGIAYVGHAEEWDDVEIDGSIEARDCSVTYFRDGRKLAVAVVHRDLEGLRAEVEFERSDAHPGPCSIAQELEEAV
jgi:NADPH-dependent 2,4-dienoyl-CoA reductase/sulfur reductase-like enzyme/nitrite reductase/ring-hydroxylating ferredoxin subunit